MIAISIVEVVSGILGTIVGIGVVAGAISAIARTGAGRPLRWLWRTNVATPLTKWHEGTTTKVVDERVKDIVAEVIDERIDHLMHHRNSGSSLFDLSEKLDTVVGHVNQLLEHDEDRDVAGKRYGAPRARKVAEP